MSQKEDSLQKVSFALKKYIESSYEHYNNLILSLGCVICSIAGTYYASSRIGDILLGVLVILYLIHFQTFEYFQMKKLYLRKYRR